MKNIVDRLLACANDPMWANHAEGSKELCASAAEEIESLRELLLIVRAERDELAAGHYAAVAAQKERDAVICEYAAKVALQSSAGARREAGVAMAHSCADLIRSD